MNQGLFRFEEISVRGLCMELFRNLWMVFLIGAALWLGSTGLHKLTYKPQYTSYSTLVVTLKGQDSTYSSLSIAKQMADVFGMVFQSEVLREKIIEDTGEDIQGTIDCQPVNETNLLVLSSTSQNPRQAYLFIHSALKHYEEVDRQNYKRVIHAVEICRQTGLPYSSFRTQTRKERPFRILQIGLKRDREELYDRINRRVDQMIADGLVDEARRVYPFRRLNSLNTVGYKELFNYFDGEWTLDFAIEKIKRNSRVYARKQMTWFKRNPDIAWFHPDQETEIMAYIKSQLEEKSAKLL